MPSKAWLLAFLTAAFLVHPPPGAADETQSMMSGAPNADATLRDNKGNAGPPVDAADPGMVKSAPEHGKSTVERRRKPGGPPATRREPVRNAHPAAMMQYRECECSATASNKQRFSAPASTA
jgi:hypothetical protein